MEKLGYRLLILCLFVGGSVLPSIGQNVYEISIASFAGNRQMSKVKYELFNNNEKVIEQESRDGSFQFIMKEGDGYFRLKATSEGYIPKIIHFPSDNYPFINEYEIQEIDIEFHEEKKPGDESEMGEMKWSSLNHIFNVVHVDSTLEYSRRQYATTEKNMGVIYSRAIDNGDELLEMNQPEYARMHFEIALIAKENDPYALSKLEEIRKMKVTVKEQNTSTGELDQKTMDKINTGEITSFPQESNEAIVYSVQLGAFSKKIGPADFPSLPDVLIIEYEDFTRAFSGQFHTVNEAIQHKKDLERKGYKDGWIVQMIGNKRLGF